MPSGEAEPFLWLGGFAVLILLHLLVHPQARVFRDALQWLGHNPAPLVLLAGSMIASGWWLHQLGHAGDATAAVSALTPWPDAFAACAVEGWKRFVLLFHQAVIPPPVGFWHPAGVALQALISAAGQVWLCSYLITSQQVFTEDWIALRRTAARWRNVGVLALCHLPWWWVQDQSGWNIMRNWLVPEFLLFLAPFPLAIAATSGCLLNAGGTSLLMWKRRWLPLLLFALTAIPLLTLLEYCLHMLDAALPASRPLVGILVKSLLASTLHLWLFATAALLLLHGAYREPEPPSP